MILKAYVESIRKLRGVVNTALVLGGAEAIIANKNKTLVNTQAPGKDWAKSLLTRMGFVKRKAIAKSTPKCMFLSEIAKFSFAKCFRYTVLHS